MLRFGLGVVGTLMRGRHGVYASQGFGANLACFGLNIVDRGLGQVSVVDRPLKMRRRFRQQGLNSGMHVIADVPGEEVQLLLHVIAADQAFDQKADHIAVQRDDLLAQQFV